MPQTLLPSIFLHALLSSLPTLASQEYRCLDSPDLFKTSLKVGVAEGRGDSLKAFEVTPMSADVEDYSYALKHAFVVLPKQCTLDLGLLPNVGDQNGRIEQWMGRFSDLLEESQHKTPAARDAALSSCTCGWVLFLHGSGGFTYDNPRYTIMMAASGYAVLAPDSFASPVSPFRYKAPITGLASHLRRLNREQETLSYWCSNNVYLDSSACTPAMKNQSALPSYSLCYSSDAMSIASHADQWRQYYERVFYLRKMELDYVVRELPEYIRAAPKVFIAGESEGGMAASRYYHPQLETLLSSGGRIILQWSCQWSYYVSCPENARIGGGKAWQSTPILNIISDVDPFFSTASHSVAFRVSHAQGGYGAVGEAEAGNCFAQLQAQGFEHAWVIKDEAAEHHGLTADSGNLVRTALLAFMSRPRDNSVLSDFTGPGNRRLCNNFQPSGRVGGLASCTELGDESYVLANTFSKCAYPGYRYHLQYHLDGKYEQCAKPRTDSQRWLLRPRVLFS